VAVPRTCRRLLLLVTLAGWAGALTAPAAAEELLRMGPSQAGDARPIVVAADDVATWAESGEQVILLRGKVLIEQGVVLLRSERAVVWVDLAGRRESQVYRVQVIADGDVRAENGSQRKKGGTVLAELATRQEVRLRQGTRAVQQPQGADPFFRRALALRPGDKAANGIQQTSASSPAVPAQGPAPAAPQPPSGPSPIAGTPLPSITLPGARGPVPGPPSDPNVPPAPPRTISIQPRTAAPYNAEGSTLPTGERAVVVSGGVILTVRTVQGGGLIDIEADRLVIWTRGDSERLFEQMRTPEGHTGQEVEFYLEGNVIIRTGRTGTQTTLQAERVYYDVQRNVAVALQADLEVRRTGLPEPLHMRGEELYQVSPTRFEAVEAQVFSSRLPSDPGLKIVMARASLEERTIERHTIFGQPVADPQTGKPQTYTEQLVRGENVLLRIEDVPVFYLPVIQGDANNPLGPLRSLGFSQDRIFGTQVYTTFDVWNLLNRQPLPGTRWDLEADYLSRRGPALGTNFEYGGRDLFGLEGKYAGLVKLYGIHDVGTDILGGGRGDLDQHPEWRGRALFRHSEQLFDEFTFQTQVSLLSDKNFLEQYYKTEFDTDVNQQTFVYLRQEHGIFSWSGLVQPHVRNWVTEDVWLPRADGNIIGQSFFNLFTYNLTASGGYAELRPTSIPPPPTPFLQLTDKNDATGRFDVNQELSLPFYLGPVRLVPYGVLDLTYYSQNLQGDADGRFYGGGGVRGSLPLSRLYPNVQNDLFNLNGLYHKIVLSGNYFVAHSSDPFTNFPQLDRLNDDATDQAIRDITPRQPFLNPANGVFLATSQLFDPQVYAIRRLLDNHVDTLDSIEVFQADLRQRWQTKRGFPGQEHVVDWLTLDLSASFFPHPSQNFGSNVAFLEYDATWNVGDRTALVSSGWVDPIENGPRVFTIGAFLNRTDRTSFFLGYRLIDPIESRALTSAVTYVFSPKYAITASSTYDFGINQSLSNSLVITRIGSDLTMSLGFTYNALLNNFGFTIAILPNLVAMNQRTTTGLLNRAPLR
jgi:hypothetical protein